MSLYVVEQEINDVLYKIHYGSNEELGNYVIMLQKDALEGFRMAGFGSTQQTGINNSEYSRIIAGFGAPEEHQQAAEEGNIF